MNPKDASPLIDTSKMSAGQREALTMAEESRDTRALTGFVASIFDGKPDFNLLIPFPPPKADPNLQGEEFLYQLETFLAEKTDPDEIDRSGEIPDDVIKGLARLGAFGIKIPKRYGGLGLSQTLYSRAAIILGSHCGNLTALLSAHQSIGVPQPLLAFGTEEQKQRFLPLFAKGQISAFALTEKEVGSDPARMTTQAVPSKDGSHYILNGEKIWCTNGLKASHIVVMARTPSKDKPLATTAFIVDTSSAGVEIITRCHFMGLRALYNGVIRFTNVKVPRDHVVFEEGRGLKVALTTLNTGRLTLPAACVGLLRNCLTISTRWASEREQWGQPIGKHAAIAAKIADLAADALATEAMVFYTSALVDADAHADIRLEAAIAKLWGTEAGWRAADQTMQIKGGRGYETAASLANRGETPDPIERMLRDCRINTIFEGSSEIMRLFIAREALDPHLRRGAGALDSRKPPTERARTAASAALFYATWYPSRFLPFSRLPGDTHPSLRPELRKIARQSRKLSRTLFHHMIRFGPKLEHQQLLLGRLVDIGSELFAMATTCAYTNNQLHAKPSSETETLTKTTRYLCSRGHRRIRSWYKNCITPDDQQGYKLTQALLREKTKPPAT